MPAGLHTDHRFDKLDIADTALLLIDHQVGTMLFGLSDIDSLNLRNNTLMLAEASLIFEVPVVLTTSNPTGVNGPLFSELTDLLPDAPVIDRLLIDAWEDVAFVEAVKATGRKQLVMAGVTTDVCLAFPAIGAAGDGYDVYGVTDASGALNAHGVQAAMFRMSQAGVKIASTNMVVAEMQRDWALPTATETGALFARRQPNFGYISQHLQQAVPFAAG